MAVERSISNSESASLNKRSNVFFDAAYHQKSMDKIYGIGHLDSKKVEKRRKRLEDHKKKEQESQKVSGVAAMSDADIRKMKFRTNVPERIIRQALLVFDRYDLDNSGFISQEELKDALFTLGMNVSDKQLARIMMKFDQNNDGVIDIEEFLVMVNKIGLIKARNDLSENNEEEENVLCAFIALGGSPDKSGQVSTKKLAGLVESFGLELDVATLLLDLDEDGDGTVDFQEFEALFASHKSKQRMTETMINIAKEPTK